MNKNCTKIGHPIKKICSFFALSVFILFAAILCGCDTTTYYTVTFDANGGLYASGVSSVSKKYELNASFSAPTDAPSRVGYDFIGYATSVAGDYEVDYEQPVTKTVTYYAKWEAKTYTVTFKSNGQDYLTIDAKYDSLITAPDAPTLAGNTFVGWHVNSLSGSVFSFETSKIVGNLTLVAAFSPVTYSVEFDSNGGTVVNPQTVAYGSLVSMPANPTRTGYLFTEWQTLDGKAFDFTTTVDSAIKLKAKWTALNYSISYSYGNGETPKDSTLTYDTAFNLPAAPTRVGYDFKHFTIDGKAYAAGARVINLTTTSNAVLKCEAVWSLRYHNVTSTAVSGKEFVEFSEIEAIYGYNLQVGFTATCQTGYTSQWSTFKVYINSEELAPYSSTANRNTYRFNMPDSNVVITCSESLPIDNYTVEIILASGNVSYGLNVYKDGVMQGGNTFEFKADYNANPFVYNSEKGELAITDNAGNVVIAKPERENYDFTTYGLKSNNANYVSYSGIQIENYSIRSNISLRANYTPVKFNHYTHEMFNVMGTPLNGESTECGTDNKFTVSFGKGKPEETDDVAINITSTNLPTYLQAYTFTLATQGKTDFSSLSVDVVFDNNTQTINHLTPNQDGMYSITFTVYAQNAQIIITGLQYKTYEVKLVDKRFPENDKTETVNYGASYLQGLTTPSENGYDFSHYMKTVNGETVKLENNQINTDTVKADTTYAINYTPQAFKLNFDLNGGTAGVGNSITDINDRTYDFTADTDIALTFNFDSALTLPTLAKTGHQFSQYTIQVSGTKQVPLELNYEKFVELGFLKDGEYTISADYAANAYTVNYYAGTTNQLNILSDTYVRMSAENNGDAADDQFAIRDMHGNPISIFSQILTYDQTSSYVDNSFSYIYNEATTSNHRLVYVQGDNLNATDFSNLIKYEFVGWCMYDDNGEIIRTIYSSQVATPLNLTSEAGGVVSLYPVWKRITSKVSIEVPAYSKITIYNGGKSGDIVYDNSSSSSSQTYEFDLVQYGKILINQPNAKSVKDYDIADLDKAENSRGYVFSVLSISIVESDGAHINKITLTPYSGSSYALYTYADANYNLGDTDAEVIGAITYDGDNPTGGVPKYSTKFTVGFEMTANTYNLWYVENANDITPYQYTNGDGNVTYAYVGIAYNRDNPYYELSVVPQSNNATGEFRQFLYGGQVYNINGNLPMPAIHKATQKIIIQWNTLESVSVTFNLNTSANIQNYSMIKNSTIGGSLTAADSETLNNIKKTGYKFKCWNANGIQIGTTLASLLEYKVTAPVTISADWTESSFAYEYDFDNGTNVSAGTVLYSRNHTVTAPSVYAKHDFVRYDLIYDGQVIGTYNVGDTFRVATYYNDSSSSINYAEGTKFTFKAIWTLSPITITNGILGLEMLDAENKVIQNITFDAATDTEIKFRILPYYTKNWLAKFEGNQTISVPLTAGSDLQVQATLSTDKTYIVFTFNLTDNVTVSLTGADYIKIDTYVVTLVEDGNEGGSSYTATVNAGTNLYNTLNTLNASFVNSYDLRKTWSGVFTVEIDSVATNVTSDMIVTKDYDAKTIFNVINYSVTFYGYPTVTYDNVTYDTETNLTDALGYVTTAMHSYTFSSAEYGSEISITFKAKDGYTTNGMTVLVTNKKTGQAFTHTLDASGTLELTITADTVITITNVPSA